MRIWLQSGFLLLTVIGVFVIAGNAESWCPFGGIEALYTYLSEGTLPCSLAFSNFYILGAVVLMTLLLRRAFCGYVCPVGTISDWVQRTSAHWGVRPFAVPVLVDRSLSMLKYLVLGTVLFFTYRSAELVFRGFDPCYALISRHGEDITIWAYAIAGAIIVLSIVLTMPFCRWLCPLAAALSPFSVVGFARIKRDDATCVRCGECANVCPMAIPVHRTVEVRHARCISCLSCLDACPTHSDGALSWGPPGFGRRWPHWIVPALALSLTSAAVAAVSFFAIPSFVATRGEAGANTAEIELEVDGLTCRGRATLLMYFLERDDVFALSEFLELQAWPGSGAARVIIGVDSSTSTPDDVKRAMTEPYYDEAGGVWRFSPFAIRGFDPLE